MYPPYFRKLGFIGYSHKLFDFGGRVIYEGNSFGDYHVYRYCGYVGRFRVFVYRLKIFLGLFGYYDFVKYLCCTKG